MCTYKSSYIMTLGRGNWQTLAWLPIPAGKPQHSFYWRLTGPKHIKEKKNLHSAIGIEPGPCSLSHLTHYRTSLGTSKEFCMHTGFVNQGISKVLRQWSQNFYTFSHYTVIAANPPSSVTYSVVYVRL